MEGENCVLQFSTMGIICVLSVYSPPLSLPFYSYTEFLHENIEMKNFPLQFEELIRVLRKHETLEGSSCTSDVNLLNSNIPQARVVRFLCCKNIVHKI